MKKFKNKFIIFFIKKIIKIKLNKVQKLILFYFKT